MNFSFLFSSRSVHRAVISLSRGIPARETLPEGLGGDEIIGKPGQFEYPFPEIDN